MTSPGVPTRRTQWHLAASAGTVFWLVALLSLALARPFVDVSTWLMVHLLLLGAVTNAILVWSAHFAAALLKTRTAGTSHRSQATRLVVLNAGVFAVVIGVVAGRWPLTVGGAVLVGAAVAAHGIALALQSRAALPSRFGFTVRYYIAASACLPFGAALGAVLARTRDETAHGRLVTAHLALNLLGWIGLTVLGTVLTLWPTMLRTRIAPRAERQVRQALPLLLAGILVIVAGSLTGHQVLAAAGAVLFLLGVLQVGRPMLGATRRRGPTAYATWSVIAAMGWLILGVTALAVLLVTRRTWVSVAEALSGLSTPLAAGFAAQVLLGALTYLVPVVLGGGPARVRESTDMLERGGMTRVAVINLGLIVVLAPVPDQVRGVVSTVMLLAYAAFLVLLALTVRAARRSVPAPPATSAPVRHIPQAPDLQRRRRAGEAVAGLAIVALAVAGGVALDPTALMRAPASAPGGQAPTDEQRSPGCQEAPHRHEPQTVPSRP